MPGPNDIVNDLLDDDALDPKKLFDENEYSTLIIDRGGFNKKENVTADLLEDLLNPEITRNESEAIFSKLKEANAQKLLVTAIEKAERVEEKILITAACWECGLDFSNDFLFFVGLACNENFKLAMEALTVVENSDHVTDKILVKKALEIALASKNHNQMLVSELITNVKSRL